MLFHGDCVRDAKDRRRRRPLAIPFLTIATFVAAFAFFATGLAIAAEAPTTRTITLAVPDMH